MSLNVFRSGQGPALLLLHGIGSSGTAWIKQMSRLLEDTLDALLADVAARHEIRAYGSAAKVLVLMGVHRARDLDPDDYDDRSVLAKLRQLAKDGPEVGVHVVAWADRKASLDRRFDTATLREFGLRLVGRMSEDDSRALVGSDRAAAVTPAQLVFDDFDKAVTTVVRRLGFPGDTWISDVVGNRS